jgi:hypothetical protein
MGKNMYRKKISVVSHRSLFFWSVRIWWIPMLVVLGVWRYLIRNVPFRYDPLYWGARSSLWVCIRCARIAWRRS